MHDFIHGVILIFTYFSDSDIWCTHDCIMNFFFLMFSFLFFSAALFASRLQALCGGTMSRIFSGREFRNQSRFSKLMVAISLKITLDLWKAISNNMWWFFFKSRLNLNVQFRDNNFVDFVKHSLLKSTCCCPFIKMY